MQALAMRLPDRAAIWAKTLPYGWTMPLPRVPMRMARLLKALRISI
jgi:hypothetical protein